MPAIEPGATLRLAAQELIQAIKILKKTPIDLKPCFTALLRQLSSIFDESIEEEQTVAAQNVTPVIGARARARRTTDLRNSSGVGDRLFIDNHVATLNQIIDNHAATFNPTEQNSRHVICSTCNKALYVAPLVEFFLCPGCRNVTSSLDADHVT